MEKELSFTSQLKAAPLEVLKPLLPLIVSAALAPFNPGGLHLFTVIALLGLGVLYVYLLEAPVLVMGAVTALAWLVVGLFIGGPVLLRAMGAGCCVVLPLLVKEGWAVFVPMFQRELRLWEADRTQPVTKAVLFLDTVPVEIRIVKPFAGGILSEAPLIAPAAMPLGEVFTHFLDDEESNRRQILPGGKLAWSFHTARLGQPRYLDPELSLRQNRVPARSVITATAVEITPILTHQPNTIV